MPERGAFRIGSESIEAGMRRTIDLPVSVLSDHTPITMSAHVIHGRSPGPTAFVRAGIHGDEIIGIEIVRRLLRLPGLKQLKGTLIVVPIVNAFGFINQSRYLPDRRDLNRCFPGSTSGSLAARLAHLFLHEIVGKCQFGIDLHSAAIHRFNLPQVRVAEDSPLASELADAFGAPVILRSALREGSLRAAAKHLGVDVLLYEAGEALRFDEFAARVGVSGIRRVLRQQGMLPAGATKRRERLSLDCRRSKWLRAPAGGLVRVYRSTGDIVDGGDLLAVISDPFGEVETRIRAPFKGIIIGRGVMPIINEGDALFHLAAIESDDPAQSAVAELATQLEGDPLFDEDEII